MADQNTIRLGVQDTSNPVFDATVNIMVAWPTGYSSPEAINALHAVLLSIYEKEPKPEKPARLPAKSLKELSQGR